MNRRRNSPGGKRWLHLAIIVVLTVLCIRLAHSKVAQAVTIDVTCDVPALVNAINTANTNGEADVLNLTPACTYTLNTTLYVLADSGNPLTIEGSGATISGNNAVQVFDVAVGAILDLNALTVTNGFVSGVLTSGGGIVNSGTLTLTSSTVSGNTASSLGGGGIANVGILTLIRSTVSGNTANVTGGGIANLGTLTLADSTVSGNTADGEGGGVYNSGTMGLTNSTVSGNTTASIGGGIYNDISGTGTLTNAILSANTATNPSSGIANQGVLTLTNSTVANNPNGGIFNDAGGTMTLINSTIASNGDVGIENRSALTLTNSTVANHTTYGIYGYFGSINLINAILANNNVSDCGYAGLISPSGGNLVEDGSCSVPGALTGDPMLGGLTGSPSYFPLLSGSPAIDAGDNTLCPATDQRGASRPFDGDGNGTASCDLGSYELDTLIPVATPVPTSIYTPTPTSAAPAATAPPPPPTPLCEDHNFAEGGVVRASLADALGYAVNCRVLYQNGQPIQWLGYDLYNAGNIGIEGIFDLGVLQAVDIFSPMGMNHFEGGAVFCLRGQGTLIWLAARNSPRIAEIIGSYAVDDFPGFTCTTLFEPGTLVLVRDNPLE